MVLSRWQPFNAPVWSTLQNLQTEMNRLFHRWADEGTRTLFTTFPPLNVWERGEQLFVQAELPGLQLEELEILVTGQNQLTLKGERKPSTPEKSTLHRQERGFGRFVRVLTLPFAVDAEKVEAKLANGVLTLTLNKHECAKPRKIAVHGE